MSEPRPNGRWFRDIYRDAVWESEDLTANEKAAAETYARHARDENGDKSATADLAWLTYDRLMPKAGIGRRANVSAAVSKLVEKGWLTKVREVSRRATLYRLTIPAGSSGGGTTEGVDGSSTTGTTVVPLSASGSSTSPSGSSGGGTQPLEPSKNQPSNPSFPARTGTDAPHPDQPGGKDGESEFDSEQEPRINTLTDVILNLRPDDRRWTVKSIRTAIARCLAAGKHMDDIERAFPVCAMDPNTKSPGRLPMDFHWWALPELPGADVQPASHTGPRCDTCWDSGLHTTDAGTTNCPDCTNDGNGNCRHHRGQYAHTCGGCRGDRLAEANRQGRPDWPATQSPNNLPAVRTDTTGRRPASQHRQSANARKAAQWDAIGAEFNSYGTVEEQLAALARAMENQ